jgi:hypothetical protein
MTFDNNLKNFQDVHLRRVMCYLTTAHKYHFMPFQHVHTAAHAPLSYLAVYCTTVHNDVHQFATTAAVSSLFTLVTAAWHTEH